MRLQPNATSVADAISSLQDDQAVTVNPSQVDNVFAGANFRIMRMLQAALTESGAPTRIFFDVVRCGQPADPEADPPSGPPKRKRMATRVAHAGLPIMAGAPPRRRVAEWHRRRSGCVCVHP